MFNKLLIAVSFALTSGVVVAGGAYSALDADGSGAISKAEATVLPSLTEKWEALDADSNGELSVEEFAQFEISDIAPVTDAPAAMPATDIPAAK